MISVKTDMVQQEAIEIDANFNYLTNEIYNLEKRVLKRIEAFKLNYPDIWKKAFHVTLMHRIEISSGILERELMKDILVKVTRFILSNVGGNQTIALDPPNDMIDDVLMYHISEYENLYTATKNQKNGYVHIKDNRSHK